MSSWRWGGGGGAPMPYRTESVTSADGTTIGYREFGRGPGVVLIHGGMQAAQNFTKLAEALADAFTVYVPDRRGRGQSGPFGDAYSVATECADLDALLRKTGARCVFGLSSGALIALHAALALSGIDKLALYEPPLTTERARPTDWAPRFERELDRGHLASAMVTAAQGTGDVSPFVWIPRFVLVPLVGLALRADAKTARGNRIPILALIPTLRFDVKLVRESEGVLANAGALGADVLLLGGDRSARALRAGLDALAGRLPKAKRIELKGIGHLAADDNGRPAEVAGKLRAFLAAPHG